MRAEFLAVLPLAFVSCHKAPVAHPPAASQAPAAEPHVDPVLALGRALFFDEALSHPEGQSCAACHGSEVGYTGPDASLNSAGAVYEGAHKGRFGNRKPPSAAYAGGAGALHLDAAEGVWSGGMFWDGRARGDVLGDPLAEQAMGPFLNPVEQALPDAAALCAKVAMAEYAPLFRQVYGADSLDCAVGAQRVYDNVGRALAAWERSPEVNPFSSRYDAWLRGEGDLSEQELRGLALFEGKALCAECHPTGLAADGTPRPFTDFSYDNLGLPPNPANSFYAMPPEFNPDGAAWVDEGLGAVLRESGEPEEVWQAALGLVKVPTLRNVDKRPTRDFVKSYGHNGVFKSLDAIVHFYNTRDVLPGCRQVEAPVVGENCWPGPEVARNVNTEELGDLGLSPEEERDLVVFLGALSDR